MVVDRRCCHNQCGCCTAASAAPTQCTTNHTDIIEMEEIDARMQHKYHVIVITDMFHCDITAVRFRRHASHVCCTFFVLLLFVFLSQLDYHFCSTLSFYS